VSWRLYAQRATAGSILHAGGPAELGPTGGGNGNGAAAGALPAALRQALGHDGRPLWLERGTILLAEEDEQLAWAGLCSFQRRTPAGREVEFQGITYALDLIGFEGRIREWEPDPYDLVTRLVAHAQAQPDGDVGLVVVREDTPATYAGDEKPPTERPPNVKRRKGETKDAFDKRREARNKDQREWDNKYGDRRPYEVAWWEAPYVGDELRELADEIPFDWHVRHRWTSRANLERRSELVLSRRRGVRRDDVALVQGVNLASVIAPTTDLEGYGNRLVVLGAGEGSKMRRASVGARDSRIRTTRFLEAKHVRNQARLEARARDRFERMAVGVSLDQAELRGGTGGIEPGDELHIESDTFTGWGRVRSLTRSTAGGNVRLTFTEA